MKVVGKIIILISLSSIMANAIDCRMYHQKGNKILNEAIIKQSYNKAYNYLIDACSKNCLDTCNLLGILYYNKDNNNQYFNIKKGDNILLKACNMGHGTSCINIAKRINNQNKLSLLNKAIENEAWQAYYYLGNLLFKRKKYPASIQMYHKACEHQVRDGCIMLAHIYYNGVYATRNLILSNEYARQAGYTNYSEIGFTLR